MNEKVGDIRVNLCRSRTHFTPLSVCRQRQIEDEELDRKWGKVASKRGAMGDVVSNLLAPA